MEAPQKIRKWSSLKNMKSTRKSRIQIQLLPPYIYLNLPSSTPLSLNPPLNLPNSTPQIWIQLCPLDLVCWNEVLLKISTLYLRLKLDVWVDILKVLFLFKKKKKLQQYLPIAS